jgi:chromosome partitioning protein
MAHVICIVSQKGGTGKTTTAVNVAGCLALLEKKTLVVDCDPLGNATTGLGIDKTVLERSLFDVLARDFRFIDAIVPTRMDFLWAVPATSDLMALEKTRSLTSGIIRLRRQLAKVIHHYDYIILDAPPSLGFMAICAMVASSWLLIPIQLQIFTLEGVGQLLEVARNLQKTWNPDLKIAGVLFTMCHADTDADTETAVLSLFKDNRFRVTIPYDRLLRECSDFGKPLVLHDITARGARSYLQLTIELVRFFELQPKALDNRI